MSKLDKFVSDQNVIFAEPEWQRKNIAWLWDDEWYDGPMRGMIELHGKRYYAQCCDIKWEEIPVPSYQTVYGETYTSPTIETNRIQEKMFCVYELTKERLAYQEYWHSLHDLIMDAAQDPSVMNPDVYTSFYMGREAADYEPLDLESGRDGTVVGWFIEGHEV